MASTDRDWKTAPTRYVDAAETRFAYPDAGHGGIFQYHERFLKAAKAFFAA